MVFAVAMLVAAGFAAGLAISVRHNDAVDPRAVRILWAAAALAVVVALVAVALG